MNLAIGRCRFIAPTADSSAFRGFQNAPHNLFKFIIAHKGVRLDHVIGHESVSLPILARRGIWVEPRKIKAFSSHTRMKRLFCLVSLKQGSKGLLPLGGVWGVPT
jgi:hypothetical protein